MHALQIKEKSQKNYLKKQFQYNKDAVTVKDPIEISYCEDEYFDLGDLYIENSRFKNAK